MIFKRMCRGVTVVAGALALAGCPGQDDNKIDASGVVVHFAETHLPDRLTAAPRISSGTNTPSRATGTIAAAGTAGPTSPVAFAGGYDRASIPGRIDISDGAAPSNLLSIYRAYVVVDEVHLEKCTSIADLPRRLFDGLFPPAAAHGGGESGPVGDRGLDKLNVIDFVTQDEFILALGDRALSPGRYCGIHVSFARLAGDAYGRPTPAAASTDDPTTVPEIPDMTGKMFAMRADYCSEISNGSCVTRTKVDIDDAGLTIPDEVEIELDQPIELDALHLNGFVVVGIAYGEWAAGVDVSLLPSDAGERQKFIDNIAASVHLYEAGIGDLPQTVVTEKTRSR